MSDPNLERLNRGRVTRKSKKEGGKIPFCSGSFVDLFEAFLMSSQPVLSHLIILITCDIEIEAERVKYTYT